jgi:hypothetical protein
METNRLESIQEQDRALEQQLKLLNKKIQILKRLYSTGTEEEFNEFAGRPKSQYREILREYNYAKEQIFSKMITDYFHSND